MLRPIFITTVLLLTLLIGSGVFLKNRTTRSVASVPKLNQMSYVSKSSEIERKLFSLLCYHAIVQKKLKEFDQLIPTNDLDALYLSRPYLSLSMARDQILKTEEELKKFYELEPETLESKMMSFAKTSPMASHSVKSLIKTLRLPIQNLNLNDSSQSENDDKQLEKTKEFQIYQQNIEHLSYLLELKLKTKNKHTRASKKVYYSPDIDYLEWPYQTIEQLSLRKKMMNKKEFLLSGNASHQKLLSVENKLWKI